ncbi:N-acetylneuraminate synthase family protein [Patescibacteria group bacterium]|nr:N-acetylneuraminate synthase family protein [Patescibacteria group bacterium]
MKTIKISQKLIGGQEPCFIIAEAGINHNGDINIAKKMIDSAIEAGVDAVKFQTFTAKEFISNENEMHEYKSQGKIVKESALKMFERNEFKEEEWKEIAEYCKQKGIIFFSTPQDLSNLELLLRIEVPAIKVGSDDLVNLPLLEGYSKKGLPMIISTGMAYLLEIDEAVRTIKNNNDDLAILHCISSYPAEFGELNLEKIKNLRNIFPDCVIGFSDHSEGAIAAIIAVALGAKIIEKHFTLDKSMPGSDHWFSADPEELKELVKNIRSTEKALGDSKIKPTDKEVETRKTAHRSITASQDIKKGEKLTEENIAMKRPGTGILSKFTPLIIGKEAREDIKKGELISFDKIK